MRDVSLTDFVKFVHTQGTPRLTLARDLVERGVYDPATDYWKLLRERIIHFHKGGSGNRSQLDAAVSATSRHKARLYEERVRQYKRFLGRKKMSWFRPPRAHWTPSADFRVRVNPELGLIINGTRTLIKLHFTQQKLTQSRVAVIQLLMRETLRAQRGTEFGVLDIPNNKLLSRVEPNKALLPLLYGEATSLEAICNNI